jgi:peptide/nickel transport system substrate-binding protein
MIHVRTMKRRRMAVLASGTVALLALAGCAPATSEPDTGDVALTDFSIAVQTGPNSLDPAQLANGQQMFVWTSVLDTLLARDTETGETIPHAAEAWEYNADGTVLTLTLREGMTFSDESPVDAAAVVATMERTRNAAGPVQPKFARVTEIVATDDLVVEIRFDRFDPQFVPNLAYGAGAIGDPNTLDEERTATDPLGSGPFTLDLAKSVPGSSYVLNRRDDYWNADEIKVDTFTVRVIQDTTATFNALQAGEVEGATVQTQLLSKVPTETFTQTPVDATGVMLLDLVGRGGDKWPALGDPRVREALNLAIDREGIVEALLGGRGSATNQVFNPDGEAYVEDLQGTYEYDPERGRQLVEEAGFAGETFEIPSTYLTTNFESTLSQAFKDVGLNLEWVPVPAQQAQSAAQSGDYGIVFQLSGFSSPAEEAFSRYAIGGYGNPLGHTDDVLEGLFDTINSTVNNDDAIDTYRDLNEYAVEQGFVVPIVYIGTTWTIRDGVTVSPVAGLPTTIAMFNFDS